MKNWKPQTQAEMGRAVVYVRVSSWSQAQANNVSLTVQEKDCVGDVTREDGKLVEVLRDAGKSGLDINRPAYLRVLDLVQSGQVDTVVIWAVDRIGRDAAEYHRIRKMFKALGVRLHAVTQDLSDPLIAGIYAGQAEQYSEKLSFNVRNAQAERMTEGKSIARPSFGYLSDQHPDGGHRLIKNPDTFWKVAKIFDLYATGSYGLTALAVYARQHLSWNISRSALSRILTNPTYVGDVYVFGRNVKRTDLNGRTALHRASKEDWKVWDGEHDQIVTQEVFDAVQAVLAKNQTAKAPLPKERQLLIGLIYCKCGARMQGVVNRAGRYRCYFCPKRREKTSACDQPYVAVGRINAQVQDKVRDAVARFTGETRAAAIAELEATKDRYLNDNQVQRGVLERAKTKQESMIAAAYDELLAGIMPRAQVLAAQERATKTLETIENELRDLGTVAPVPNFDPLRELDGVVSDWATLDEAAWRGVVEDFVLRVDVAGDVARTTLREHVEALAEAQVAEPVLV